jgi:hypothetical protein
MEYSFILLCVLFTSGTFPQFSLNERETRAVHNTINILTIHIRIFSPDIEILYITLTSLWFSSNVVYWVVFLILVALFCKTPCHMLYQVALSYNPVNSDLIFRRFRRPHEVHFKCKTINKCSIHIFSNIMSKVPYILS